MHLTSPEMECFWDDCNFGGDLMKVFCLAGILALAVWGQANNGVTVTVSRTVPVPVTEACFSITATTPTEVPFGEVLLALRGAAVTANDLQSMSVDGARPRFGGRPSDRPMVRWTFSYVSRSAELAATLVRLTATANEARTASAGRVNMSYSLISQGPSRADVEAARRSVLPQLWNDAKARAQALAAAAGTKLEGLGAISEFGYGNFFIRNVIPVSRLSSEATAPSQFQQNFSMTAQFSDRLPPGAEGITVGATQPGPPPTQTVATLNLDGPLSLTLDQALVALQPLGILATDLTSTGLTAIRDPLSGDASAPSGTTWTFHKMVPLNQLTATLTAADALRTNLNRSFSLDVEFRGLSATPAEREAAGRAALSEMTASGRRLAQDLARAAGYDAGEPLGIGENGYAFGALGTGAFSSFFDYADSTPFALGMRFALKK